MDRMSDLLVEWQEKLANYPSWVVAGGAGFVVAVIFILIGKVMRVVGVALLIAVLVAAGWYLWENVSGRSDDASPPSSPTSGPPETTPPLPSDSIVP